MNNKYAQFRPDYWIAAIVILLALFGVIMVYSSTYHNSIYAGDTGQEFFVKQAQGVVIGLVLMFVLSYINYSLYSRMEILIAGLVAVTVLLVIVLFLPPINGAWRWIRVGGFVFQPAEIARFIMLIFTSTILANNIKLCRTNNMREFVLGLRLYLVIFIVITVLVIIERSLSVTLMLIGTVLCLFIVAGVRMKPILLIGAIGSAIGYIAIVFNEERMGRVNDYFNAFMDASRAGYQMKQSLYALGAGGIFGAGFTNSKQKLLYLPYGNSDFILSVIGEEFGFVGVALLLIVYVILIVRCFVVAMNCKDMFGSILAAGITVTIALQLMMNVAVITGSIPATGVPLPFISSGNTSLVIYMSTIGILLNISRQTRSKNA